MLTSKTEPAPPLFVFKNFGCSSDKPDGDNLILMRHSSIIFLISYCFCSQRVNSRPLHRAPLLPRLPTNLHRRQARHTPTVRSIEFTDVSGLATVKVGWQPRQERRPCSGRLFTR